jgi:hypothetical protein
MKLDLACGQNKREGYHGVDFVDVEGVDEVVDLLKLPWPWDDDTVEAAHSSHFVEHIPHDIGVGREGFFAWFDELYRVCKHDAEVEIYHPYAGSTRAFQDPTHRRFIPESTWYYLNKEWRELQRLDHYQVVCDFEIVTIEAIGVDQAIMLRNSEARQWMTRHLWDAIADLRVILRARKA